MPFFLKSENFHYSNPISCIYLLRSVSTIFLLLLFNLFIMGPSESECRRTEETAKVGQVQIGRDKNVGEITVQSNALTVLSFNRRLDENGFQKSTTTQVPDYKGIASLGRSDTIEKLSGPSSQQSMLDITPDVKSHSTSESSVEKSSTITTTNTTTASESSSDQTIVDIDTEDNHVLSEVSTETSKGTNNSNNSEERADGDIPSVKVSSDTIDGIMHSGEDSASSELQDEEDFAKIDIPISKKPLLTTPRVGTTQSTHSKPPLRNIRTKYPYLKKVPSRLVASYKPQVISTKRPTHKPTSKWKQAVSKQKTPRPATPIPEHFNPHHPHGIVVFDKRKRRPKPGRTTTATTPSTTTTTSSTTMKVPSTTDDSSEYGWTSVESEEEGEQTKESNATSQIPTRPPKVPLSKLAIAMISSSTNFDNGTDEMINYQKTPINLLYLLQAYTKQLQVANSNTNGVVETMNQPIRIQSTPFMLQLSQLNFAAKIGISIYYSLIAIIPLIYLAFGGIGRLGFLNGFIGKKKRRKRSFNREIFYDGGNDENNRKNFNRKSLLFQMHVGNGGALSRADLNDEGNDDEYSWILGKISEIILEFSLFPEEQNRNP